jgi:hypothetical protein
MKIALFLLAMLPWASFAQQTDTAPVAPKTCYTIHFDKIVMHDETVILTKKQSSYLTIEDGNFMLDGPVELRDVDTKKYKGEGATTLRNFRADKVAIYDGSALVLKADVLFYDYATDKGTLKGHITISGSGTEKELGSYAVVDFTGDQYKIEKLK